MSQPNIIAQHFARRGLLVLIALPLLTFCSCKGLQVPFRPLLPTGDGVKPTASTTTTPTATTAASPTPAVDRVPLAAVPKAGYQPPRLVRPVGYYPGVNAPAPSLPSSAYTGQPMHGHGPHGSGCPCCGPQAPFQFSPDLPGEDPYGGWMPDGIKKPWPSDEYICDGGDNNDDVRVKQNWDVVGLDPEDTIAHFDTLDGKTEVAASNKCCIYAPRFAAIRKVMNPIVYEGHERMAGVEKPTKLNLHQELGSPTTAVQPEQVLADLHIDPAVTFREQTKGIGVDNVTNPVLARGGFMPHENLKFIQQGIFENAEKAVLAERTLAAVTWQSNQAVQVIIEGVMAHEAKGIAKPEVTYTYEMQGKARLRICKIASSCDAQVGEFVEFTLRFDNVGDQKIGNVTIIDHLTPRLEYVAKSQSCTVGAEFKMQENPDTLVLRWEVTEPLEVGQGGLIRFRCRVR
ncbi:hypothetical protein ETAA8_25510 [Anatilimnocola aggregata]|uniref:Uncharacterized protein n=1 Tax=Anatilimnocola aggregata TaxID=2528021 RepID=A0A517YB33_9BACT|nr:DUF11 domain-containing protein [Anatilimnocola aggregata]QDU27463.1 hypothetical protein ETAA8_25510 [Anatilimnocola aggregata]